MTFEQEARQKEGSPRSDLIVEGISCRASSQEGGPMSMIWEADVRKGAKAEANKAQSIKLMQVIKENSPNTISYLTTEWRAKKGTKNLSAETTLQNEGICVWCHYSHHAK